MALDNWLPVGFELPDHSTVGGCVFTGTDWQIVKTAGDGRALIATGPLFDRWVGSTLIDPGLMTKLRFGSNDYWSLSCASDQVMCPVKDGKSPNTKAEALAFAQALKATRDLDRDSPLQDALYIEKISRLLPTYGISSETDDDLILGYWLTGGASIPAKSFRRLQQTMSWLAPHSLKDVVEAAGFDVAERVLPGRNRPALGSSELGAEDIQSGERNLESASSRDKEFELPGRPDLAAFINEHIVDLVQNRDTYSALGIDFPSAVVLHGPPGCGKTFAIEQLIEFLGWPSYQIDASSVASPYIHETSKKVAEVFEKAMENAPSILVIDEMEAFLTDREMGVGQHRVEEVAEFLRRIPEATKNEVLIVAMTNRIDMIDSAILRRGRFDHVIEVGFASETEVLSLLEKLLSTIPTAGDIDLSQLGAQLTDRPLSDVTFVVREGARLAARAGKRQIDQESLLFALHSTPARNKDVETERRIGFI